MTRLLVLHPHPLVSQSLITHLQPLGYDVQSCTTTLDDAVDLARQLLPDLVLADVHFDEGHGFESARMMQLINPRTRTVLALPPDKAYLPKATQTDASGYLPQKFELPELETCLQTVLDCFRYVSPAFAKLLTLPVPTIDPAVVALIEKLPIRERECLRLVSQGLMQKEIAARMGIKESTVASNKITLAQKFGLSSRRELAFFIAPYRSLL